MISVLQSTFFIWQQTSMYFPTWILLLQHKYKDDFIRLECSIVYKLSQSFIFLLSDIFSSLKLVLIFDLRSEKTEQSCLVEI